MRPLPRRARIQQQRVTPAQSSTTASTSAGTAQVTSAPQRPPVGAPVGAPVLRRHEPPATAAKLQSSWVTAVLDAQKTGVPPLQRALLDGDFAVAEALLDAGASVKAEIRPPLVSDHATTCTLFSLARPDAFALRFGEHETLYRNECITRLAMLTEEASPRRRLELNGTNALTLAVACRAPDALLAKLCALGSREYPDILNHRDACGRTPLATAAAAGHLNQVVLLLGLGADPDRTTGFGRRALQLAAEAGHRDIFIILLDSGARLETGDESESPLELCVRHRRADLLEAGQHVSSAHRAAISAHLLAHAKALLGAGDAEFATFIRWAAPLLTDRRLAQLAISAVRVPGAVGKLVILCDNLAAPFPVERLWALRMLAGRSGDPEIIAYVSARYPVRTG